MICSLAAQPAAGEFSLALPVDCTLDVDCHIQQFVDHDPGPDTSDFACGSLTYDGHKGTDFALPSLAALSTGVDVLAAADGIVRGVRDDMPDALQGFAGAPDVRDRECGNGVVIDHGDGFETQYCHLARGSVTVQLGDRVAAKDVLGQIGLSGQTEFPHLHLSVRRDGAVIDPFDPDGQITCGTTSKATLWESPLNAPPGGIITTGWSAGVPDYDAIKAGTAAAARLSPSDPLVAWVYLFGARAGDRLEVALSGPAGQGHILRDVIPLDRTQAQSFRAFGKRAPGGGWPLGTYVVQIAHYRGNIPLDQVSTSITITP